MLDDSIGFFGAAISIAISSKSYGLETSTLKKLLIPELQRN